MQTLIDQMRAAMARLDAALTQRIEQAMVDEDRRRTFDRRRTTIAALEELREELGRIREQVHANTKNLETQFARIAEMQQTLDRLNGKRAPRFKGDETIR